MKVLILGSAGMAGSIVSKYLSSYYNVTSLDRQKFDCLKHKIPSLGEYDYVINCIGKIKQKQSSIDDLYEINSKFPRDLCKHTNKLIHISSDCVFSGKIKIQDSYYVEDVPDAIDDYGKSKYFGENPNSSMVLRTSIIGPAKDNAGLFEWFRNNSDNEIRGYVNHIWSGITTLELAKVIEEIIRNNKYAHGLYHLSSDKISKYDLLKEINNVYNMKKNIIAHNDVCSINRSLSPIIYRKNIRQQLFELKEFVITQSES
jgi:dTDP-4-dehydrorhamnose reductase